MSRQGSQTYWVVWVTTEKASVPTEIFNSVSRQKFSVTTGFGAGPGLGCDKGLLVSPRSFPKGGTFLSRQKILCHDRVFQGGITIGCLSARTTGCWMCA